MFDPAQLQTLAAILRSGSFEGAAAALRITPPAVSQRIRALEERAGSALLIRSQPVTPTEAGRRLARHADDLALLDQALARDLGRDLGSGRATVRIAVNADSLETWFLPALAAAGDFLFELVIDDQDHSEALLAQGEVAAVVTAREAPQPGAIVHPLGALRYVATASPAFRDRWFPGGLTAAAFAAAPALLFSVKDRLQRDWAEGLAGGPIVLPSHVIGSSTAFVEAARLGLGWAMNPELLVADMIRRGDLVALAPGRPLDVPLFWQANRLTADALAPLTRAVRQAARSRLIRH